jgi:hypothetical protein
LLLGLLVLLLGLVLLWLHGAGAGHMEVPVRALGHQLLLLHGRDLGRHGTVAAMDCAWMSCSSSCHGAFVMQAAQQLVFKLRGPVSDAFVVLGTSCCCLLC